MLGTVFVAVLLLGAIIAAVGITIAVSRLQRAPSRSAPVSFIYVNVYGGNANVAQGDNLHQIANLRPGDMSGLLNAAHALGLQEDVDADLQEAVKASDAERPGRIRTLLNHVRNGSYALAIAVSGEVVASRLEPLIHQYLGSG